MKETGHSNKKHSEHTAPSKNPKGYHHCMLSTNCNVGVTGNTRHSTILTQMMLCHAKKK